MTTLSSAQSKSAQCHTVLRFVNVDVMVEAGKFSFFKLMRRDGEMGQATGRFWPWGSCSNVGGRETTSLLSRVSYVGKLTDN
jgi:hypothetical protein